MLLKQPALTTIAVLTLTLGIGSTSAVFSLIHGVLLTPPPYHDPGRLVTIAAAGATGHRDDGPRGWAPLQWQDWQKKARSFERMAAYDWTLTF